MRLRPIEHLENRRPKCKMHTHSDKKDSLHIFVFYNWSTKKTEPKPKETRDFSQNRTKTEPNLKSFRTSL